MGERLIDNPKNKAARKVYEALPRDVDPDGRPACEWATAAEVAAATGYSRSSVRTLLQRLHEDGSVARDVVADRDGAFLWRAVNAHDPKRPVEPDPPDPPDAW